MESAKTGRSKHPVQAGVLGHAGEDERLVGRGTVESLDVVDLVPQILSIRRPAGRSMLKEPVGQCHARVIEEVGIAAALHCRDSVFCS